MSNQLSDRDWRRFLECINNGTCTPFLGSGTSVEQIPLASEIAEEWAEEHDYPLMDRSDLARVAQYVAIEEDDLYPKSCIAELCDQAKKPNFEDVNEIHRVLADLPLPVYITTNYDSFMTEALEYRDRKPKTQVCKWNGYVEHFAPSQFGEERDFEPSSATPLVYHFHGSKDMEQSIVLTEEDYIQFLVWFSREWSMFEQTSHLQEASAPLPDSVVRALSGNSLLFIGYSRTDWSFRVVFQALVSLLYTSSKPKSIAVQLLPLPEDASEERRQRAQTYLNRYFEKMERISISVYWGSARCFAKELRRRWEEYQNEQ